MFVIHTAGGWPRQTYRDHSLRPRNWHSPCTLHPLSMFKGKDKVPSGCLSALRWPDFPCPWSQVFFVTMPPSSALSQLHILCVVQLLSTPQTITLHEIDVHTYVNYRLLLVFVPSIIHNLARAAIFPQWLSQVILTWAQTCYPQMREPALWPRLKSDLLITLDVSCRMTYSIWES